MPQQQIEKLSVTNLNFQHQQHTKQVVINTSHIQQNHMSSVNFSTNLKVNNMSSEILPTISTEQMVTSTASATDQNTSVYIMAGAAAGIMEHCLMYPVDSIKVIFRLISFL